MLRGSWSVVDVSLWGSSYVLASLSRGGSTELSPLPVALARFLQAVPSILDLGTRDRYLHFALQSCIRDHVRV